MNTFRHLRPMLALGLMGAIAAPSAWASCAVPTAPKSIPDGRKAEMAVMLEAKRDVEQYLQHVSVYAKCENDGLRLQEALARQKVFMDRFNAEVRAFKAVNRN